MHRCSLNAQHTINNAIIGTHNPICVALASWLAVVLMVYGENYKRLSANRRCI